MEHLHHLGRRAGGGQPHRARWPRGDGPRGWFGWPEDVRHEELRNRWAAAGTLEDRRAVAREMQENAWNFVPHLYFGQWTQPVAHRGTRGWLPVPELVPFWNVERV
jgi:peptide/nickel transport system substrate-binding protein